MSSEYKPKDFLETSEGLVFAVVAHGLEDDRVYAFLRYVMQTQAGVDHKKWKKLNTEQANSLLRESHPSYLFHSIFLDADLHGVPIDKITKHHQPAEKLKELMSIAFGQQNPLQKKLVQLVDLLLRQDIQPDQLGVTGSFLIGAENEKSDIDLVIYDRSIFHQARIVIKDLIHQGELSALDDHFWKDSYDRRGSSLTFEEYVWHEKRKFNKAIFKDIKLDLSLVLPPTEFDDRSYSKKGKIVFSAKVIDDQQAFDSPCSYELDHQDYKKVICFTPTYAGQAAIGDVVEVSGFIEESEDGQEQRIIVGSNREALGEYIKVIS